MWKIFWKLPYNETLERFLKIFDRFHNGVKLLGENELKVLHHITQDCLPNGKFIVDDSLKLRGRLPKKYLFVQALDKLRKFGLVDLDEESIKGRYPGEPRAAEYVITNFLYDLACEIPPEMKAIA